MPFSPNGNRHRSRSRSRSDSMDEYEDTSSSGAEGGDSSSATLPQMLEKYSAIYNKNGRIGIYTRAVRIAPSEVFPQIFLLFILIFLLHYFFRSATT
jgi:hypothetical protein